MFILAYNYSIKSMAIMLCSHARVQWKIRFLLHARCSPWRLMKEANSNWKTFNL